MENLPCLKPDIAGSKRGHLTRKTFQELASLDELTRAPLEEIFRDPRGDPRGDFHHEAQSTLSAPLEPP